MTKIIATLLFTLFITVASVSAQTEYCFENKGLKGSTLITFAVSGSKITDGEFQYGDYDATSSGEIQHFVGTKNGNNLNIKFSGTIPEVFKKVGKITWTLGTKKITVKM